MHKEDVKNRVGRDKIVTVEGVPETDWRYDDKEPATWSWSRGDDEEEIEAGEAVEDVCL